MPNVVIVGAGIAGLTAGIYAQKSGFDVTICESHTMPGGNCTSWRRKGYLFEGGMHWLNGSGDGKSLNKLWREVGAITGATRIMYNDPFLACDHEGQRVSLYRNMEKFEAHFYETAPEDREVIRKLCRDMRRFARVNIPIGDIPWLKVRGKKKMPLGELVRMIPAVSRMAPLGNITAEAYAERFKNPALRLLLSNVVGPSYNAISLFFILGCYVSGDGGYIEGGSLAMVENMVKQFTALGGNIRYSSRVDRVLVSGGRTVGVSVPGGAIPADAVIVTADTLSAADTLFDKPLTEPWVKIMRRGTELTMNVFLCYGFEADLSELPDSTVFVLDKPFEYADKTIKTLGFRNYARYPGYAPPGCSAVTVTISKGDTYGYWKNAKENGEYEKRKQELSDTVLDRLEAKYPALKGKAAVRDTATPLTYERYCGTYHGSWMTRTAPGQRRAAYPCKAAGMINVYFAGQRLIPPGGMPPALLSGRTAVQHLCRDFKQEFVSS
ncbi:MAG: NAD(P)/FAD-dependent oxidoreductase [Treponema sp.]|jgi:phytoene dehydrogenase-like protein|nr:NAD(P)/FAD-dependent oxidoreductase [Treponema sp.]